MSRQLVLGSDALLRVRSGFLIEDMTRRAVLLLLRRVRTPLKILKTDVQKNIVDLLQPNRHNLNLVYLDGDNDFSLINGHPNLTYFY